MRRLPVVVSGSIQVPTTAACERILATSVPLASAGFTTQHLPRSLTTTAACSFSSAGRSSAASSSNLLSSPANTRLVVAGGVGASASGLGAMQEVLNGKGVTSTFAIAGQKRGFATCGARSGVLRFLQRGNDSPATVEARRFFATGATRPLLSKSNGGGEVDNAAQQRVNDAIQGVNHIREYKEEEKKDEQGGEQQGPDTGYLPFPPPFHTINIVMILFLSNIFFYSVMNFCGNDDIRDFIVTHFTLSHENWHLIYPFFTSAFYQEALLQLAIDCWLLWQFGNTVLGFLGAKKMLVFWAMTSVGGGLLQIGRQYFELFYGIDPLEVRGRCYGPNPFILGLVAVEGLIFRHLNFMQNPPVPFLVMTAFVMIIDVWRIFTTKPEEHGAPTGGALVAYLFWALPNRFYGLSKLTAAI